MKTAAMPRYAWTALGPPVLLFLSPNGHAGWSDSLSEWFDENVIDEEDGKVDASDYPTMGSAW